MTICPMAPADHAWLRMDELMLCVPQGTTVGVGISIISYNGELRIGFLVDRQLMPDSAAAAASVRGSFEQLRRAACAAPVPAGDEVYWPVAVALDREACAR